MKNRLPRTRELAIFAAMALICTLIVAIIGKHEVGFAVMGAPVFFVGAMMGLRRSGELATGADEPAEPE
jgi:hypothetical protein